MKSLQSKNLLIHPNNNNNLCNMKVMMIPIAVDALGMVPKGLGKSLKELKIWRNI